MKTSKSINIFDWWQQQAPEEKRKIRQQLRICPPVLTRSAGEGVEQEAAKND